MENEATIKTISTRELVEELVSRAGVELYRAVPYGDIRIHRKYTNRGEITCPCVLLVNEEAYGNTPDSLPMPDAERE